MADESINPKYKEDFTEARIETVYVVRENNLSIITQEIKGMKNRIEKSRRQGFGGAGGWTPFLMVCDMNPVKELLATDAKLVDKEFNVSRITIVPGSGGMGYGGIGNGVRIGGGGFSGTRSYTSKRWGVTSDSLTKISVDLSYSGFMIEKAFVNGKLNYIMGGLIGAGEYTVKKNEYKSTEPSAFGEELFSDSDDHQTEATFTAIGLYGGITYSLVPWFHVGGDASLVSFIGIDGFNGITDSFITGAGIIRLRLIRGNLG
jgi:hypothetical protein